MDVLDQGTDYTNVCVYIIVFAMLCYGIYR